LDGEKTANTYAPDKARDGQAGVSTLCETLICGERASVWSTTQ